MNITLHIERLVLDGVSLGPGGGQCFLAAVEAELSRLLADGGLGPAFRSGGTVPRVKAAAVSISRKGDPAELGMAIARSLYHGLQPAEKE